MKAERTPLATAALLAALSGTAVAVEKNGVAETSGTVAGAVVRALEEGQRAGGRSEAHPEWVGYVRPLVDTGLRPKHPEWDEGRTQVAELFSLLCKLWFPVMMYAYWRTYRRIRSEGLRQDWGTWTIFGLSNSTQLAFASVSGIPAIIATMSPAVLMCAAIIVANEKEKKVWTKLEEASALVAKRAAELLGAPEDDGRVTAGRKAFFASAKGELLGVRMDEDGRALWDAGWFKKVTYEAVSGVHANPADRAMVEESERLLRSLSSGDPAAWEKVDPLITAAGNFELPGRRGSVTASFHQANKTQDVAGAAS